MAVTVACELLGAPCGDRGDFRIRFGAFLSTSKLMDRQFDEDIGALSGCLARPVARREHPADDLLGAPVRARDEDNDRLSEEELLQLAVGPPVAGHGTAASQAPDFAYVLPARPDEPARLRRKPVPAAAADRAPEVFTDPERPGPGRTDSPHPRSGHGPRHYSEARPARTERESRTGRLLAPEE